MNGTPWVPAELEILRRTYAHNQTADIAAVLGRSHSTVYQKALGLGLKKAPAYLASPRSGRLNGKDTRALSSRFKKGQESWSKGTKGLVGVQPACRATQFAKGAMPHNHKPVGHERITVDGYLERKIAEPKTFRAAHVLVWESVNGPVPAGHAVCFRDGKRTTTATEITIDKLELVSRAELMRRNSYHNKYPKEIGLAIQLRGALIRKINKRSKAA